MKPPLFKISGVSLLYFAEALRMQGQSISREDLLEGSEKTESDESSYIENF
jgi:hypothetical protein